MGAQLPAEARVGLRSLAACGGCAAKADPATVAALTVIAAAHGADDSAVLAGLRPFDDAAVYRLDAERALVATVDFFPPLLDDARDYAAVSAANAVSDVYAMGGEVAFALVIAGFPASVPAPTVAAATESAARVVAECGGQVLGGHTIRAREPVFGLCVIGFVHPERVWRKAGAHAGDVLVLSKPVGTGVLISEHRPAGVAAALASMRQTNAAAARLLGSGPHAPHAVTDVSGYGLLGHALEMAERSGVCLRIDAASVPLLDGALEAARAGVRTSADRTTRAATAGRVSVAAAVPEEIAALCFDPQTSGGLLAAVTPAHAERLREGGFHVIGTLAAAPVGVELR